jgi:hypothetical protein
MDVRGRRPVKPSSEENTNTTAQLSQSPMVRFSSASVAGLELLELRQTHRSITIYENRNRRILIEIKPFCSYRRSGSSAGTYHLSMLIPPRIRVAGHVAWLVLLFLISVHLSFLCRRKCTGCLAQFHRKTPRLRFQRCRKTLVPHFDEAAFGLVTYVCLVSSAASGRARSRCRFPLAIIGYRNLHPISRTA